MNSLKRITPRPPPLLPLLLMVQLVPSIPMYFSLVPSMALASMAPGTAITSVLIISICWSRGVVLDRLPLYRSLGFAAKPALIFLIASALILLHLAVASLIQPIDLTRSMESLALFSIFLISGMATGAAMYSSTDALADRTARISFWVLCGVIGLAVTGLQPRGQVLGKSMFPYTETSHFALAFIPMLMYQCVRAARARCLWYLAAASAAALLLQSVSLAAGCLLVAAACRRLLLVVLVLMAIILGGLPLELAYFTDRLDFSATTLNLSNLVYVQGWEQIQESLGWTSGWGVGFQQMGFRETEAAAARLIRFIMGGDDLNVLDGGFVFAKIVSEFGVFGVLLTVIFLVEAARCIRALRAQRGGAAATLASCIVVSYGIDMFVRGTGYFVESTLLFVAAVTALMIGRNKRAASTGTINALNGKPSTAL